MKNSDNNVLLKLHRQYSTNEGFNYMYNIIKKLRIDIGILKSEISELKHNIDNISKENYYNKYIQIKSQLKDVNNAHSKVIKSLKEYQEKYFDLKLKQKNE